MWKNVIYQGKEYENLLINEEGRLLNKVTGTEYKFNIIANGYVGVCISLGSRKNKKLFKIHKAVAETFLPNPLNYREVNHIDGNKQNNNVDNLEWCSRSYNVKHAWDLNLKSREKISGQNNCNAKLNPEKVKYIRDNYIPFDKNYGIRALARLFNVNKEVVRCVVNNKSWKYC